MRSRLWSPRLAAFLAVWFSLLALMIGLLALPAPATVHAQTLVGGLITTAEEWTVTGSPYIVESTISIGANGSLTIYPGVEVLFQAGTALRVVDGPLMALGEAGNPVTFTADDGAPSRGFWAGLVYEGTAPPSELRHCIVEYAATGLAVDDTDHHLIDGCTFRHNGDGGTWETGGALDSAGDALIVTNNVIYDNEVGLHLHKSFGNLITGNEISGNDGYGIAFLADSGAAGGTSLIADNEIHHNGGFGIGFLGEPPSYTGSDNVIRDNLIYGHTAAGGYPGGGIYVYFGSNNELSGNRIWDNASHGIWLDRQTAADVSHNVVRGNGMDGLAYGADNGAPASLHGNVLCNNGGDQLASEYPSTLPAEGNWFGTNTPLATPTPVPGAEILGDVDYTPWISLALAVEPPVLPADGSSTAAMTVTMTGGGYAVPDGYTVTLTPSHGTIAPPVLPLVNGQGEATYTAGTISTTVDITVADGCATFVFGEALTVEAHLDLAVDKDDGGGVALVLDPVKTYVITYTFAYSNTGLVDAAGVTLTDTLPAGSQVYAANGWDCDAGTCTYAGGPLAIGAQEIAPPLVVEVLECGELVNEVTIGPLGADYDLSNNTSTVTSTLACLPDLAVVKDDRVGPTVQADHWLLPRITLAQQRPCVDPGDEIAYSILYANTGLVTATGVVLTETLPENAHHVGTGWNCAGRTCTYEVGSVAPGAGGEVFFTVEVDPVPALALVVNRVEIGGLEQDLYPFDNVAYEDAPICGSVTGSLYLPLVWNSGDSSPPPPPPPPPPEAAFVSDVAVNPETGLVYVASPRLDAVFVIDPEGEESVVTTVPVGDHPLGLAVVTSTNKVYAANLNSWDVTPIRGSDHVALAPIYAGAQACKVAADPATGRVYVANHLESDNGAAAIDSQTDTRLWWYSRLHATQGRYGIDVDPAGGNLFIAARDAGLVAIQDIALYDQDPYMFKPQDPARVLFLVAFNPATGHLFITAPYDNVLLAIDPYNIQWGRGQWITYRGRPVFLLERTNDGWIREFPLGLGAEEGIAVNPLTGYVYVTNGGSDTVSVVRDDADPEKIEWVGTIDVGDVPQGVAVDARTNTIYVGNAGSRTLSVIDGETHTVIKTISLE